MGKQKVTRRERFLEEMEQAVPWARLVALIEPFHPQGKRGRPPLRVYFLQQWYALADEALEDAIPDSRAMRAFIGGKVVPDAASPLGFRHLLEAHDRRMWPTLANPTRCCTARRSGDWAMRAARAWRSVRR